ncbi:hypothetical protein LTR56_015382 [Elasticomyces elasticus]|nr:hypothetical protein LTR56_015382 [Elasticomyces elasticus]KAK3637492.1 hypothetical protein LTR22_018215 [Elasticomyces elasticus]KAK4911476.1 hypothetical protein LTR49_019971 [Elasticomyces elasticus]KAK5768054.1 hypothetical protein LTS12_001871 [Elasticomyces elasticus]
MTANNPSTLYTAGSPITTGSLMASDARMSDFDDRFASFLADKQAFSLQAQISHISCCILPGQDHIPGSGHGPACYAYPSTTQPFEPAVAMHKTAFESLFATAPPSHSYEDSFHRPTAFESTPPPSRGPHDISPSFSSAADVAMPPFRRWHSAPDATPSIELVPTTTTPLLELDQKSCRTSLEPDEGLTVSGKKRRPRVAHRIVEQRYRNSLNGEIDALRCMLFPPGEHSGAIPHKTEVLQAAAATIKRLATENASLRTELRTLREVV